LIFCTVFCLKYRVIVFSICAAIFVRLAHSVTWNCGPVSYYMAQEKHKKSNKCHQRIPFHAVKIVLVALRIVHFRYSIDYNNCINWWELRELYVVCVILHKKTFFFLNLRTELSLRFTSV
jgi:hypothetical protein